MGHVCRPCWILCAGYRNKNNGRVRKIEAKIRAGDLAPELKMPNKSKALLTGESIARAFMTTYIFSHSQNSPSGTHLYVDFCGMAKLHAMYKAKKFFVAFEKLDIDAFRVAWNKVLREGVTDYETAVHYTVEIRKSKSKGFKKCYWCEYFKAKMRGTTKLAKREGIEREFMRHILAVYDDRDYLARIIRLCMTDIKHFGAYFDAADSNKYPLPTTRSTGKNLAQLWRLRQKFTCFQLFDTQKSLIFFRTLPNVATGGNLTATLLFRLFGTGLVPRQTTDFYLNVDGSSDNICFTTIYALVHLLLCTRKCGWALQRIHVLRMKVGHTHCDLDATFGLLSRYVPTNTQTFTQRMHTQQRIPHAYMQECVRQTQQRRLKEGRFVLVGLPQAHQGSVQDSSCPL